MLLERFNFSKLLLLLPLLVFYLNCDGIMCYFRIDDDFRIDGYNRNYTMNVFESQTYCAYIEEILEFKSTKETNRTTSMVR